MTIVKWWKSKKFLTILLIIVITMMLAFMLAYFIPYGWIGSIIITLIGGYCIRRIIINLLNNFNNG